MTSPSSEITADEASEMPTLLRQTIRKKAIRLTVVWTLFSYQLDRKSGLLSTLYVDLQN